MELLFDHIEELWFWRRFVPGEGCQESQWFWSEAEAWKALHENHITWYPS